jgi:hypothetical protein
VPQRIWQKEKGPTLSVWTEKAQKVKHLGLSLVLLITELWLLLLHTLTLRELT